ncbi:MAG: hypothetical protein ACRCVN_05145 [Spirochaetia bacterium]
MSQYFDSDKFKKNSLLLKDHELDKLAHGISEKIAQTLEKYPSTSHTKYPLKADKKNTQDMLSIEKSTKQMYQLDGVVSRVSSHMQSSLNTLNNLSDSINTISSIQTMKIKEQGEAALKNLQMIYIGTQGLITVANDEFEAFQEARSIQEEERKLAIEESEYAHRQALYDRDLSALETALSSETNIRNAKKMEQELEEKRRAKRLEEEKRKADIAERKRQEDLNKQEAKLLQEKQLREWEYEVSKTQIQNNVGQAIAESERQASIIDKTTKIGQLSASMALASAEAAIAMAQMNFPVGIALLAAVGVSGAQIGMISASPLPPSYTPAPLPARPFAQGGIVPAVPGGVPIQFGRSSAGIVAEAGENEIVMPLNSQNIQKFLQPFVPMQQDTKIAEFTYAPEISLHLHSAHSPEETFSYIKENLQRDLFDTVEEARRRFQIGT